METGFSDLHLHYVDDKQNSVSVKIVRYLPIELMLAESLSAAVTVR